MPRYIDADNFRKIMIKRFGCIPCLTDYSETSRYDIPIDDALNLAPSADVVPKSEVEKLVQDGTRLGQENQTLKDNNEHLAVMLEEAKSEVERLQEEANRYKRYFFRHDYDEMIAEVLDKLDRFINSNCIEIKDERGIKGYVTSGVHFAIAELKKKYTEGEE